MTEREKVSFYIYASGFSCHISSFNMPPRKNLQGIGDRRKFRYFDGSEYEGTFRDGVSPWTGEEMKEPTEEHEKKSRCGVQHGTGLMQWHGEFENNTYDGEWEYNQTSGDGKMKWENGTIYNGQWKKHKMHGSGKYFLRGVCELPMGDEKGVWKDGKFTGKGRITWQDEAEWYEGDIVDDKFEGYGSYQWADNRMFIGEWENDKMHGQGTYVWRQAGRTCTYKGAFENDMFEGYGECVWGKEGVDPQTATYKGEWHKDEMSGSGIYFFPNGDKYDGQFRNNKMDGEGTYYWVKGYSHQGIWRDGQPFYDK